MSFQHNTAYENSSLELFYENAPKKPYCTDYLPNGLIIRTKTHAFGYRYVQHNPPAMAHWLTFDQDHDDIERWKTANLPAPNLIVRNMDNRRCHVHYAIDPVCVSDAGKPKPMRYMAAIEESYCEALGADVNYVGLITKNPLHDDWHVWEIHDHIYTLGELADYVELKPFRWTRRRAANQNHQGYSRHNALFDRTRFWAYDHIQWHRANGTSYNQWMKLMVEKCEGYSDFQEPLPYSSVKATAKSVGSWVWKNYCPSGKRVRRGLMAESFAQSQVPLDLTKRQRLSARNTNKMQKEATEQRIIKAIEQLTSYGKRVTKVAVAGLAGISRQKLSEEYKYLFLP